MQYLQNESYYQDRYDRLVIDKCRNIEEEYQSRPPKYIGKMKVTDNLGEFMITREIAYLAIKRQETIDYWILEDRRKDDLISITTLPRHICDHCGKKMKLLIKSFKDGYEMSSDMVLYLFKCLFCKRLHGIYSDNSIFPIDKKPCPSCANLQDSTHSKERGREGHKEASLGSYCKYKTNGI